MWPQEELTSEVRERNGLCRAVFRIENTKLVFTDSFTIICMACVAVICDNRNKMKFFYFVLFVFHTRNIIFAEDLINLQYEQHV